MTIYMSKDQISVLPTTDLAAIVRGTNPTGGLAGQYVWAKEELKHRAARHHTPISCTFCVNTKHLTVWMPAENGFPTMFVCPDCEPGCA